MTSLLFHEDVFIPFGVQEEAKNLQKEMKDYYLSFHFKKHLENQQSEDRSHTYLGDKVEDCLKTLPNKPRNVFEVELTKNEKLKNNWYITKYCCRIPYDSQNDLVIVIRPNYNEETQTYNQYKNKVVTAWVNEYSDEHNTLGRAKIHYCTPLEWRKANGMDN